MAMTLKQHEDLKTAAFPITNQEETYLKQLERKIKKQNKKTKVINRKKRDIKY